jgi:hypothetical protein
MHGLKRSEIVVDVTVKRAATARDVARVLTRSGLEILPEDFEAFAAYTLQDNSPAEIAAIGRYMPAHLRTLLPQRSLH